MSWFAALMSCLVGEDAPETTEDDAAEDPRPTDRTFDCQSIL